MTAEVTGANASPKGRSKLSFAAAQASTRMNNNNKASIFRNSGLPPSPTVNENVINHEDLVRPAPQDFSSVSQKAVALNGEQFSPQKKSEHLSIQKTQRAVTSNTQAFQTQPQDKHIRHKSMHKQNITIHNSGMSRSNKRNSMVQRKSHQRLILERIASKHFLNCNEKFTRYVGAASKHVDGRFGDSLRADNFASDICSSLGGNSSTTTPLGLTDSRKKHLKALAEFLDVTGYENDTEDSETSTENDGSSAISSIGVDLQSTTGKGSIFTQSSTETQTARDIGEETSIDTLLEIASNHLSLGKNEAALQAYRRAMKCAFDDVMSVKKQLGEIKIQQAELGAAEQDLEHVDTSEQDDSSPLTLSRKQEAEFESSLLQIAGRVADIHNNMGVVYELNRSYKKAQTSYCDALDVYHNTCKRFENSDDPDVDRTKNNVKRMKRACKSEEKRKRLYEKATKIVKQTQNNEFITRNEALTTAVDTLKHVLKLDAETVGSTHPVAANTLIQMGKYYYEMREYDDAVSVINEAIEYLQDALGGNHPQVCKATLLLASIYERHGISVSPKGVEKEDTELEIYVDVLDPLKTSLGEVHTEVGLVYTKIGHLYEKKGDVDLSQLAYKAALKAYGEPSSTDVLGGLHPEVLSLWVRVTENLHSIKSWEEVLVAGERALYFLRIAKKSFFEEAELHTTHHHSSDAVNLNSISIVKTSKKTPIQITSDTSYYSALYTVLSSLAQAHIALKNYQLAREASREALQLGWEIALSSQDDTSKGSSQEPLDPATLQLIRALKRLGKVILLQKYYNDALECFLPCLELLRSSKSTESTRDTASVLGSLGFLYLKLKRFNESINFLRECLRLYCANGVDVNDRETKKIRNWLEMAEARAEGFEDHPTYLEIPMVM